MLPNTLGNTWFQDNSLPSNFFGFGFDDYELYEADDEFVLTIDMPGFTREDISVSWDDGVLHIGADHSDDVRGQQKTYQRSFRLPKEISPDDIAAQYRNGVLEVTLPIVGPQIRGTEIPVEG